MIDFIVKSKTTSLVTKKGQTVYYAHPKMNQFLTNDEVIRQIEEATSLTRGDVKNALASLSTVVNRALSNGYGVDLAELGNIRVVVNSRMMDSPEDVTVERALKTPKVVFTPKREMLAAAKQVQLNIDHSAGVTPTPSAQTK